jgi:hypothetical protein
MFSLISRSIYFATTFVHSPDAFKHITMILSLKYGTQICLQCSHTAVYMLLQLFRWSKYCGCVGHAIRYRSHAHWRPGHATRRCWSWHMQYKRPPPFLTISVHHTPSILAPSLCRCVREKSERTNERSTVGEVHLHNADTYQLKEFGKRTCAGFACAEHLPLGSYMRAWRDTSGLCSSHQDPDMLRTRS